MKIPPDERFRRERAQYELRFTCDDCAMFDADRAECVNGYPTDEHRDAEHLVVFCKEFELA